VSQVFPNKIVANSLLLPGEVSVGRSDPSVCWESVSSSLAPGVSSAATFGVLARFSAMSTSGFSHESGTFSVIIFGRGSLSAIIFGRGSFSGGTFRRGASLQSSLLRSTLPVASIIALSLGLTSSSGAPR